MLCPALKKSYGSSLVGALQAFLVYGHSLFTGQCGPQTIGFCIAFEALRRSLTQAVSSHRKNGLYPAKALGGLLSFNIFHQENRD